MMRQAILILVVISIISSCANVTETIAPQPSLTTDTSSVSTPTPAPVEDAPQSITVSPALTEPSALSTVPASEDDLFTQMGITLQTPVCTSLTQPQTEGPYYKSDTPERNSLLEEGMEGTRLILVGYVLDQDCNPLPNAWLDFWQADASGEYDNDGYRLRGHQFTDSQGRYYLETILPGLYSSRPIVHIHVKVKPAGGEEVTSQLYFPTRPVEGLTVNLEDKGDYMIGYFNFVVQR